MSDNLPTVPKPYAPSEPLAVVGAVTAAVASVLALVAAFGLDLSDTQQAAILGAIGPVAALVVWLVGRARVFAPDTVRAMVQRAVAEQKAKQSAVPTTRNTGVFDGPQGDGPRELR